jgi:hypothetical protein
MTRKAAKRPGRPSLPGGREKFTTTLPKGYAARLRAIGRGNASAGIVWLVDEHEKDHPAVRLRS